MLGVQCVMLQCRSSVFRCREAMTDMVHASSLGSCSRDIHPILCRSAGHSIAACYTMMQKRASCGNVLGVASDNEFGAVLRPLLNIICGVVQVALSLGQELSPEIMDNMMVRARELADVQDSQITLTAFRALVNHYSA